MLISTKNLGGNTPTHLQALTQHTQKLIINKKSEIKDSLENEFRDKGFACQHQTNRAKMFQAELSSFHVRKFA